MHGEWQLPEDAATPAYVAPEQLKRGEQNTTTDVYAFGIVIYEMVTAALPSRAAARWKWPGKGCMSLPLHHARIARTWTPAGNR